MGSRYRIDTSDRQDAARFIIYDDLSDEVYDHCDTFEEARHLVAEQEAIDEMLNAYIKTFGEEPDNVTGMVIRTSTHRVIEGESYRWIQHEGHRRLEWSWSGFDEDEPTEPAIGPETLH